LVIIIIITTLATQKVADVMSEAWASFASGNLRGKTVGGGGTPPSMLSQAGSISLLASADVLVSA
jgi:hypothetical protein